VCGSSALPDGHISKFEDEAAWANSIERSIHNLVDRGSQDGSAVWKDRYVLASVDSF
jgi:hypothetical protein